ncbi:proline-specific peptidase [Moniliophthora roreri MCA 2997]|uniref:Proline-specific peptidase n=1 Tax=Moniliophthora roreri (strain MCA 2997) TaxID=1381753 RepID=V2YUU9_MONRO|nr:proline-specific peptidase [Moniliophthora roreri MCA 2997]
MQFKLNLVVALFLAIVTVASCTPAQNQEEGNSTHPKPTERNGTVDFVVQGKTYQTWYLVVGDLKSGKTPLVVLHGGPGFSHHYLLPNKELYETAGIPLVFYDQIGNGASSHVPDAPKEFWTPELFMDQLDGLLAHLGIANKFNILGHSWGGMLAGNYAAARVPKGLKKLIISNAPASIALFKQGVDALLDNTFPPGFRQMMEQHERDGTTDSQEYQDGANLFLQRHVCTVVPFPELLNISLGMVDIDPTVYSTMWGPSEFGVTGTLSNWTVVDIIHRINVPTLLISAPMDEIQPVAAAPWFDNIPKVKWVELQNSTHLAEFEEPKNWFRVLLQFLQL